MVVSKSLSAPIPSFTMMSSAISASLSDSSVADLMSPFSRQVKQFDCPTFMISTSPLKGSQAPLMSTKEAEKKQRELAEGGEAAAYLNQELGADYEAIPSDREPADVLFVSRSHEFPERMVQVVTIPHDYQIRADNQNLARFVRELSTALKTRDVSDLTVGFTPLGPATARGIPRAQVESLANDLVLQRLEPAQDTRALDFMELLAVDPELSIYLSNVVLFRDEGNRGVTILTPGVAAALPHDGSWIEDGLALKLKRYDGSEAVKELTLVIGVEALVDAQQVEAFRETHKDDGLPFKEILINSAEGTMRLK